MAKTVWIVHFDGQGQSVIESVHHTESEAEEAAGDSMGVHVTEMEIENYQHNRG
jgi:hypothetical protein